MSDAFPEITLSAQQETSLLLRNLCIIASLHLRTFGGEGRDRGTQDTQINFPWQNCSRADVWRESLGLPLAFFCHTHGLGLCLGFARWFWRRKGERQEPRAAVAGCSPSADPDQAAHIATHMSATADSDWDPFISPLSTQGITKLTPWEQSCNPEPPYSTWSW